MIKNINNYNEIISFLFKNEILKRTNVPVEYHQKLYEQFNLFINKFIEENGQFIGIYNNLEKLIVVCGFKDNYIMFLNVIEEYKDQKIGFNLLKEAINRIKAEEIYLDSSEEAYNFYKKYGFIDNGEVKNNRSYPMKFKK